MSTDNKAVYVEPKTIASIEDLLAFKGATEAVQIDYTEDAWSYGAPPPGEQVYKVKLFLDKDGIKQGLEDQKNPKSVYFQYNLICKITDNEEYNGIPVYSKVTTRIFKGKGISTMAGLLAKLVGDAIQKLPNPMPPEMLAYNFGKVLGKEPIVKCELDWRGAYKYTDKEGKEQWENVFRHYKEFPIDPEDKTKRLHVVTVSNKYNGGSADVRAQTQINRFFGKNEEPPKQKVIGATNGIGGVVSGIPELVLEDKQPVLVSQPRTGSNTPPPVADDLDLVLDV